jgi:hypothetical protein
MRARIALKRAGMLSGGRSKQRANPRMAEHHCALVCFGSVTEAVIASMALAKVGSMFSGLLIGKPPDCPFVDGDGPQ